MDILLLASCSASLSEHTLSQHSTASVLQKPLLAYPPGTSWYSPYVEKASTSTGQLICNGAQVTSRPTRQTNILSKDALSTPVSEAAGIFLPGGRQPTHPMHWRYFSRAGRTWSHGTSPKPKTGQRYINVLVWTNSSTLFQIKAVMNKLGTARMCWSHSSIMQGWSGEGPAVPSSPCPAQTCCQQQLR